MTQLNNLQALKVNRRNLRKNLTAAEATLWKMIKKRQINGERFLKQYSIGHYIVDFYCPKYKLAIELDGQVHFNLSAQEKDRTRTDFLDSAGVKVIRFENCAVCDNPMWVLEEIKNNLK